jgi:cellulose biosynthesis protein BcsQ
MKTIAIHSYKGGVGKTTVGLLLAKYLAGQMKKVCVVDLDFVGSGIANLLAFEAHPRSRIEYYYLDMKPEQFDLARLLGVYRDPDMQGKEFSCILNLGENWEPGQAEEVRMLRQGMMALIRDEPSFREIEMKTNILLKRLSTLGFDFVIADCHPGLVLVSEILERVAHLNVYVTTPNRSDCFSLFKAVNQRKLDKPGVFLVVNMADLSIAGITSLMSLMTKDPIVGVEAEVIYSHLRYLGKDENRYAAIAPSDLLSRVFYLGSKGLLPRIEPRKAEFQFCRKIFELAKVLKGKS